MAETPELPWHIVLALADQVKKNESTNASHWQKVGFPDHVLCDAVQAGAKAAFESAAARAVAPSPSEAALVAARREGFARAHKMFVGLGSALAEQGADIAYPDAPREVVRPKLTWHDAGYNKRDLADETGLIVGSIDGDHAYVGGKFIGKYVHYERAMDAVMKAALAAQETA